MPNWCTNEVDIHATPEVITQIAEVMNTQRNGYFMMNDFVPMPQELVGTEAPRDKPNWYDWSNSNWGTKWDLDEETTVHIGEKTIGLGFNTAWGPNCEFWVAFSEKYPTAKIDHKYYEEGVGFIGEAFYEDGNFEDNCQDITDKMWERAGGVLDENGDVDWDLSDVNLFDAFPLGKGE